MSMLFITHDLGVVAEISHDVMVMYCGNIMEQGTVDSIFANAQHPYTKGLLNTMPVLQGMLICCRLFLVKRQIFIICQKLSICYKM